MAAQSIIDVVDRLGGHLKDRSGARVPHRNDNHQMPAGKQGGVLQKLLGEYRVVELAQEHEHRAASDARLKGRCYLSVVRRYQAWMEVEGGFAAGLKMGGACGCADKCMNAIAESH